MESRNLENIPEKKKQINQQPIKELLFFWITIFLDNFHINISNIIIFKTKLHIFFYNKSFFYFAPCLSNEYILLSRNYEIIFRKQMIEHTKWRKCSYLLFRPSLPLPRHLPGESRRPLRQGRRSGRGRRPACGRPPPTHAYGAHTRTLRGTLSLLFSAAAAALLIVVELHDARRSQEPLHLRLSDCSFNHAFAATSYINTANGDELMM